MSWPCLARSFMRLCQPSMSLFVRTAFPKNDQARGGHRELYQHVLEQVAEARCCRSLVQLIEHAGDGVLRDEGQCE